MWCKFCNIETNEETCPVCGKPTSEDIPIEIYWCDSCKVPVIKQTTDNHKEDCPCCGRKMKYLAKDIRPVFPEERLLMELLLKKEPNTYAKSSVWASTGSRYYIDGKAKNIPGKVYTETDTEKIAEDIARYKETNTYEYFNIYAERFVEANRDRLNYLIDEATEFVRETAAKYKEENRIISFSGGKDSTVTADVVTKALSDPNIERGAHNIYVSPFEHNAVTRVLHHFEKQEKIVVRQLTVGENLRYDMERIRYQFEEEKPDFVIVSHASNSFGVVALLEDIFALAKKYGARTLADMSQTAGLIDTNVGLETFDYAVFAGHKTLYGPTGISGFVMNPEADFPAVLFGGTGFESANQDMPESLPQKYEAGTLNIAGVAGLYAAIKWINETGLGIIWEKEQEHRAKLMEILSGYDFIHVVGADKDVPYVGIVSCLIDGISSDSAGNIFDEQGISVRTGLECAPLAHQFMNTYPAGTIRFSVSYFTSDKDFKELRRALDYIEDNL